MDHEVIMNGSLIDHEVIMNDLEVFARRMAQCVPPTLDEVSVESVETAVKESCDIVNKIAKACKKTETNRVISAQPRWKRLMEENDCKTIWKAINWKGEINTNREIEQPSDNAFKTHFERLLNPSGEDFSELDVEQSPYIPLLDDPFTPRELDQAINSMNKNKSFIGFSPALLVNLPVTWLMFLLTLFNVVFQGFCFPITWCFSKLIVIFKTGDRMLCDNYRGISIMDTLAKVYDTLIMNRLKIWMAIDKCQAGSMEGRGCLEQIFALRMLCDYAIHKKVKLYVLFIDYRKAYDKVPRQKLIQCLKSLGCGKIMLKAVYMMYKCTNNVLTSATIKSVVGVKQGAPSSCLLFIIYIDQMVRMLKQTIATDGFLGTLHALLLMDDTVIVATSRDMCIKKFKVVLEYCREYGMVINQTKTKFFVINKAGIDKIPINVENNMINYCEKYLYLGAWFTDSGRIKDVMSLHEGNGQSTVNKFAIFCNSNTDMP